MTTRTCCVWCPDWPVTAWRRLDQARAHLPVAVVDRGARGLVVRAASSEARAEGVVAGLRRREAEARCPDLVVVEADPDDEAVAFEHVARAIEAITPRIELERPGRLAFPTRGPARYFGGDEALAQLVFDTVHEAGAPRAQVGVADGTFAARLAARAGARAPRVIANDDSPHFLADWPVAVLGPELADILRRLGLVTLGAFAALPEAAVLARFGTRGRVAHRRARGLDDHVPALGTPPPDLTETHEFDPPAQQVDQATFVAKVLADRMLERLGARGLACTRIVIEADTEHGETLARVWRHDGALTPVALATRVRWQLEGWLTGGGGAPDDPTLADAGCVTGGLTLLRLIPDEVVVADGRQLGFWGGDTEAADRAARALVRVQGMLGVEAVIVPWAAGGRTPDERVRWLSFGERTPDPPETAPWPGQVPGPAPTRVYDPPRPITLLDHDGNDITVSGRGLASGDPARVEGALQGAVQAWAGPWPQDLRWWDRLARHRRAIWQLVIDTEDGPTACLVTIESERAALSAVYD